MVERAQRLRSRCRSRSPAARRSSSTGRGSRGSSTCSLARDRLRRSPNRRPIRCSRRSSSARRKCGRSRATSSRLPDNGSYTRYADLGRPYVVWNVFAAPELSLAARQWCFPIAGCVAYRGYFAEEDAQAEAARIAAEGYDVHVAGVPGVLDARLFRRSGALDVHPRRATPRSRASSSTSSLTRSSYVKDDSSFNESFAVAVEEEGLGPLDRGPPRRRPRSRRTLRGCADCVRTSGRLIRGTRERLAALYASDMPESEKRAQKAAIFADMRVDYERVKSGWDGAPVFDRWFASGANNAGIVAAGLYADRVPQFAALLAAEGGRPAQVLRPSPGRGGDAQSGAGPGARGARRPAEAAPPTVAAPPEAVRPRRHERSALPTAVRFPRLSRASPFALRSREIQKRRSSPR